MTEPREWTVSDANGVIGLAHEGMIVASWAADSINSVRSTGDGVLIVDCDGIYNAKPGAELAIVIDELTRAWRKEKTDVG